MLLWIEFVKKMSWLETPMKIICSLLGIFGFTLFPSGWNSFQTAYNNNNNNTSAIDLHESIGNYNYIALALLLIMQFFVTIGITTIPFMLTGEVYPFK